METSGDVGVAAGVLGPGRAVEGLPFGVEGLPFGVGVPVWDGVAMGATAVGVTPAVAVGTFVAVGDGAGGPALRWCVQPARATSPATTPAQRAAR